MNTPNLSEGVASEAGVALNSRQIALLRDFQSHGFLTFFDSPFRLEGPGLRKLGMFEGIGDHTAISAAGMTALKEADAAITRYVALFPARKEQSS